MLTVPSPKAMVGSVDPLLKVQVIPLPDPNVVVPTSVLSKFTVKVPDPLSVVSIPVVPPAIVLVAPKEVADDPVSAANVMEELVNCPEISCPEELMTAVPLTTSTLSHPLPTRKAVVETESTAVRLAMFMPLKVSASDEEVDRVRLSPALVSAESESSA